MNKSDTVKIVISSFVFYVSIGFAAVLHEDARAPQFPAIHLDVS